MLLARVKGQVVATRKDKTLLGYKIYLIQPVDESDNDLGEIIAAVDTVSSREGDLVMYIDSREAPKAMPGKNAPIDACITGIIDNCK